MRVAQRALPTNGPLRRSPIRGVAACALLFTAAPLLASAQTRLDSWTTENGLPQNSVNDILQTRDGYLWLATFGGLVRFDGARFAVFDRSTAGIGSQRVRALFEHRDGTLWAATEDGLLIRYRDGAFATLGPRDGLPDATALRIDEADDGGLWVAWVNNARQEPLLTRHDADGVAVHPPAHLAFGVGPPRRHPVARDDVWWSRDARGLHCLSAGRVGTCAPADALPDREVIRVSADHRGHLWVLFEGGEVLHVTPSNRRLLRLQDPSAARAVSFLADRYGTVWWIRADGALFTASGPAASTPAPGPALTLYEDHEGALWIGSTHGLHRMRPQAITMFDTNDGLVANAVYSVLQDSSGGVWLGTWGHGVQRLAGGRLQTFRQRDGLGTDLVTCVFEDRTGRVWVGTTAGVAYLAGDRFVRDALPGGHLNGAVWAMHEDRSGVLWLATDAGLVRLRDGLATRYSIEDGLPHDRVTALAESRSGALWVGTYQGLARLERGAFTAYTEPEGLIGSWIRALYEDVEGVLWIGTYDGGLYRMRDRTLTRYTTTHGLHDNGVFQILEDDAGFLWMGSNRGISRVSRRELNEFAAGTRAGIRPRAFGIRDGMTTLECNGGRQPSGLKAPDGRLWFPTMGGVAIVDPRAVVSQTRPPPVIMEERLVSGRPVERGREMTVPSDASGFEIRYTAASFGASEQVRFRYMLAGLDDGWVEAGGRRSVAYQHIPPGRYEFRVTAANEESGWNPAPQTMTVVVLAPLWRQSWFAALVVVTALLAAVAADRRRATRQREERATQTAFAHRLIATQENERQRISTELHDALGQELYVIRARVRAAKAVATSDAPLREALDGIDGVARKASEDLREIAHALRPYHLDKIGLARTVEAMTDSVGAASGIEFMTLLEPLDELLGADQRIQVYRILQESVSNVARHSGAATARVTMRRIGGHCEIRVEDDGRGFEPAALEGRGAAKPGIGLMTIRERARSLGGDAEVRSRLGHGTTILATFPIDGGSRG
jgi:signal transduction histidine kinase/ligand-binding sensor domain-containing protein